MVRGSYYENHVYIVYISELQIQLVFPNFRRVANFQPHPDMSNFRCVRYITDVKLLSLQCGFDRSGSFIAQVVEHDTDIVRIGRILVVIAANPGGEVDFRKY